MGRQAFRNRLRRIWQNAWGKTIVILGSVVSSAVVVATLFSGFYTPVKDFVSWRTADEAAGANADDSEPDGSLDAATSRYGPPGAPPSSHWVLEPGACLTDPSDLDSVVACDVAHRAEVISTANGECDQAAAVEYAGGNAELDLLSDVVQASAVDGQCVVELEGRTAEAPIEGSLGTDQGDALRECFDGLSNSFVPCAEPHTGEVVERVAAGSPEQLDCDAAASEYMGQNLSERFSELDVDEVPTDAARRCVVNLRSDNSWLDTSLRNLGNAEIQTSSM